MTKLDYKLIPCEPDEFNGIEENAAYPKGYTPTKDKNDDKPDYMNARQQAYFRDLLLCWKCKLEKEDAEAVATLQNDSAIEADPIDQAVIEDEQRIGLRTRDRASKLIKKINEALARLDKNDYGYCEETGDPIGIARLLARPVATLSIEAKRRQEQQESGYAG